MYHLSFMQFWSRGEVMTEISILPFLGSISNYVIVCGDPERVLQVAELLDSYEEIGF